MLKTTDREQSLLALEGRCDQTVSFNGPRFEAVTPNPRRDLFWSLINSAP